MNNCQITDNDGQSGDGGGIICINSYLTLESSKISDNIIVDVGHNALAAKAIVDALSKNKYILVYNSVADKNYKDILRILKPIIEHVEIISIDNQRVESVKKIINALNVLDIKHLMFTKVLKEKKYLVFGSFLVVEEFIKRFDG
jgi:dihydrofolate synthase/folylpolyglutamate synthase